MHRLVVDGVSGKWSRYNDQFAQIEYEEFADDSNIRTVHKLYATPLAYNGLPEVFEAHSIWATQGGSYGKQADQRESADPEIT